MGEEVTLQPLSPVKIVFAQKKNEKRSGYGAGWCPSGGLTPNRRNLTGPLPSVKLGGHFSGSSNIQVLCFVFA